MRRCREATIEDPKAKHYINILLSSVEYETFVKLMRIMKPVALQQRSSGKAEAKDDISTQPSSPSKSSKLDADSENDRIGDGSKRTPPNNFSADAKSDSSNIASAKEGKF